MEVKMDEEYYSLKYKYPGKYLVFSHRNFQQRLLSKRKGTEHDVTAIVSTFHRLGFIGETFKDLKADEITKILQNEFRSDYTDFGSVFVFILTHGDDGNILYASDNKYNFKKLLEDLIHPTRLTPSLAGKPKVFILQACRGHTLDQGASRNRRVFDFEQASPSPGNYWLLPSSNDVLLAYSTPPGYLSHRDSDRGSWFITTLCQAIDQKKDVYDFETILTVARQIVASEQEFEYSEQEKLHKQIPMCTSTMTKFLFLSQNAQLQR